MAANWMWPTTYSEKEAFAVNWPEKMRSLVRKPSGSKHAIWFALGVLAGLTIAENREYLAFLQWNEPLEEASFTAEDEQEMEKQQAVAADNSVDLSVQSGDTLLTMLMENGIAEADSYAIIEALKKVYNPKKLTIGQNVTLIMQGGATANEQTLKTVRIEIAPDQRVEIAKDAEGFKAQIVKLPITKQSLRSEGKIKGSVYQSATAAGVPMSLLAPVVQAYAYDVDFQREIKDGDKFEFMFDRYVTQDGRPARVGTISYAALDLGDKVLKLYRYTDSAGNSDYYNEKGESVRKALLRTPMNVAKITSGFGMRRHPLLGYSKMHKGVDFGAAYGAPILAAGDGIVEYAGWNSSYGKYVRIRHTSKFATAYAHASSIPSGVRKGMRVKQGQVIAYVGSTGRSTGPHLHYEVLAGNSQVNPLKVKFPTGRTLGGKELASFKQEVQQIKTQLASIPRATQVALNEKQ